MVGTWGKKESWREEKRLTWIGWEHTTNFLGRAEDSGGGWRLASGQVVHLDVRSLRIMSALQARGGD